MRNYEVNFIVDSVLSGDEINATAQTYFDMSTGNYSNSFTSLTGYPANWNGLAILTGTGTIPPHRTLNQTLQYTAICLGGMWGGKRGKHNNQLAGN